MKLKYLLCILIFISASGGIAFSQENVVTNLGIIDKLIDESLISLSNKFLILGKDNTYNLSIHNGDERQSYIAQSIRNKLRDFKILYNDNLNEDTSGDIFSVEIINPEIKVSYKDDSNDIWGMKKLRRRVTVSYVTEIRNSKDSSIRSGTEFMRTSNDSFDFDNFSQIEDKRFSFTRSVLPEESTLNKIFLPAVLVLASAAVIILFFTIRSK